MIGRVVDVDYDLDPLFVYWAIQQILAQEFLVTDVVSFILAYFVHNACDNDQTVFQRYA
jgi:hypothetical protein